MKQVDRNIILTGLPRSGTTLSCHLLNKLPGCVALHEPLNPLVYKDMTESDIVTQIQAYFGEQRQQILDNGIAASKSTGGKVPDNPMAGFDHATGKRIRVLDGHTLKIDKQLDENFNLIIKQPAFFTSILSGLVGTFETFAIIRNPLSVLLSWNSVEMPVSRGRVPAAEAFSAGLTEMLEGEADLYQRQINLLSWFFRQYNEHLQRSNIIFYEDVIASGGQALDVITLSAKQLNEPLASKNNNSLYSADIKEMLAEKMLASKDAAFWGFYSHDDIHGILAV